MEITKFKNLITDIYKLSKNTSKNLPELREKSELLAKQRELLDSLSMDKLITKMNDKSLSDEDHKTYADIYGEIVLYRENATLVQALIDGNYSVLKTFDDNDQDNKKVEEKRNSRRPSPLERRELSMRDEMTINKRKKTM